MVLRLSLRHMKTIKASYLFYKRKQLEINNLQYRNHTNDYFNSMELIKLKEMYKYKSCAYIYI